MEDFIERMIDMDLSIEDKNNSQSSCVYELSDEVLERIKSNDHKLTSLKLGSSNNSAPEFLPLQQNKGLCEKAGILIGSNTHLDELHINIEYDSESVAINYDKFLTGLQTTDP